MAYPLESVNILRHNVIRHPAAVTGRWNPAGFGAFVYQESGGRRARYRL